MTILTTPAPGDIEQLKRSVSYECGTLISQGLLYLREGAQLAADTAHLYPAADALLESLLTKLRSLDAFFSNFEVRATDAIASDLAPGWAPFAILTPDERKMINVRIAHLTYLRPTEHEWEFGLMIRRALETMKRFIETAGPNNVHDGEQRLKELEAVLANWGDLDDVKTKNDNHAYR